jgi:hypothetical protein
MIPSLYVMVLRRLDSFPLRYPDGRHVYGSLVPSIPDGATLVLTLPLGKPGSYQATKTYCQAFNTGSLPHP